MELCRPASTDAHDQVRTPKQHVEPVHVPGDSPIRRLAVAKLPLDDQERMFNLAANGGLPVLNPSIPAESIEVLDGGLQLRRTQTYPEIHVL